MIWAIIIFGLYIACLCLIARAAITLGTLVLQVAIKCLPIAIGIWFLAAILKGVFG